MGTAKEEESMTEVEYEESNEDVETEDDDDEYSPGRSEAGNQDTGAVGDGVSLVVTRAGGRKTIVDIVTEKYDQDSVMMEAGGDPSVEKKCQEDEDVVLGKVKRRRQLGNRDRQRGQNASWDEIFEKQDWVEDSEDDDWAPIGPIKLRSHWFCTNCTMANWDKSSSCGKCGENRTSGILIEGHLSSSTAALQLSSASVPLPGKGSQRAQDMSSRVFPVDSAECGKTAIGFDERMLLHEETPMKSHPHPERPDRLRAIVAGLAAEGLFPGRCVHRPTREVTLSELEEVHSREHVDAVEGTCNSEMSYFTSDTYAGKDSSLAARIAAGISADMATAIVNGEIENGFALVRPPGHHAEEVAVMGFCLHNNASVAARAAQKAGAKKILVVDWDVHHGNGTQDIFEEDPSVLYVSLHRHEGGKFYPGTGAADEVGFGKGEGSSVNIPWICGGIGDTDYIFAFLHIVLPIAKQFAPDITIVSAGFDAAMGDPLGCCKVTPSGYAHMTSMLKSLAGGKMLVILEGGYNLRSISASTSAVIKVLLGDSPGPLVEDVHPTEAGAISMLDVFAVHSKYWPCLRMPAVLQQIARLAASNIQKKELLLGELDQQLTSSPSVQLGQPIGSTEFVGSEQNGFMDTDDVQPFCHTTGNRSSLCRSLFEGKRLKRRRCIGGPLWWKWGRRRIVYYLWCVARARKNKWNCKHGGVL